MAQGDILLTVTNIKGESNDKDVPDAIEVSGWSFSGVSNFDPKLNATSRVKLGDLIVVKPVDTSTPVLLTFMATAQLIENAKLFNRKAGGSKQEGFYRIELKNARIRSIAQKASSQGGSILEETISLGYQEITITYGEQGSRGMLLGAGNTFSFSILEHQ